MTAFRATLLVVGVVGTAAAAALAALAWLLATEAGTAWAVARLQARVDTPITIGRLSGTLLRGLSAEGIGADVGTDRLEIASLNAELVLSELLAGELELTELTATDVRYARGARPATPGPSTAASLPVRLSIGQVAIDRLTVVTQEREIVIAPLRFSVAGEGSRFEFADVAASSHDAELAGGGALEIANGLRVDAVLDWAVTRNATRYAGRGSVAGVWPALEIQQSLTSPVAAEIAGDLRVDSAPFADLEARWTDLAWPSLTRARSPAGSLQVSGWLGDYEFAGSGTIVVDDIESDVEAAGSATADLVTFDSLLLSGAYGEVDAAGRLELEPLAWQLDVRAREIDPSIRLADWPGALTVDTRVSGRISPVLEIALSEMTASGELRGQQIRARGGVAYSAPDRWRFDAFEIESSGNRLAVDGSVGATFALDVDVEAQALERIVPEAAGAVRVDARLTGTRERPEISGSVDGMALRYRDFAAGELSVQGDIVGDDTRPVTLDVAATDVVWRELTVNAVEGMLAGTAAAHRAVLDLSTDRGRASLRAAGAWTGQRWSGEVAALDVDEPTLGRWNLAAPVALSLARGELTLGDACLVQGQARLCGASRVGTDAALTEIALTSFDLSVLNAVLPDDLTIAGIYDAQLRLDGPWPRPAATLRASGAATSVTIREPESAPLELQISGVELQGDLSAEGLLETEARFDGAGGARVAIDADVADVWSAEPTIVATISGLWADLAFLSLLSPEVGEVAGAAAVDLELTGNLRAPDVRGQARLSDARIEVPRWGFVLEEVQGQVTSPDGTQLLLEATARAGEGPLMISGVTDVDPQAGWPTRLRIHGDRLQAVRLPEADIVVSPALEVRASLPNVEVNGAFLVPYARLRLEELPPQAVRPSPDTVVHGVARPERQRPLAVSADIRIGLGDDVRYTGSGLDVALSGAMGLVYGSGQNAAASGSLRLTGEYRAYGQTLEIDQGQLLFTGPLGNPNLDVRAIRRVDATTVGIQLSGTVNAPVSRVFSEPAMSEADALAYLLLGRPLSRTGDEETATLESAAFAMGLQQALPVIQRVGETLGLDEFSLQTTSADTGELMAGKRISPRLYVRYTYGLFNRIGGMLMRFNMTERLSLETRSGDYRSMDLIYTVERD